MNEDVKPTEEQVKAANEAELAKWEGDFTPEDLEVKYSNDEVADDKKEEKKDDKKEEPETKETKQPVTEEYSEPDPIVTVEDPGEYTPKDYSFEIEIDGKSVKVSSVEEAEQIAEDNAEKLNAKQIISLMTKASRMESKLERDKEEWQSQKDKFEDQTKLENERKETIENVANEFAYLVGEGLLPEVPDAYKDADWSDPEVAKQDGVKEQIELLNYMVKQNEKRAKSGIKPITSVVDAFNAWSADKERKAAENASKQAGEQRRAAGAKVAGVSASQQGTYVPKGIAVGDPNKLKRSVSIWD